MPDIEEIRYGASVGILASQSLRHCATGLGDYLDTGVLVLMQNLQTTKTHPDTATGAARSAPYEHTLVDSLSLSLSPLLSVVSDVYALNLGWVMVAALKYGEGLMGYGGWGRVLYSTPR